MVINGGSTGIPPIHVSTSISDTRIQNNTWDTGRKTIVLCFEMCVAGTRNNTRMAESSANTPPSLLGIDRRIAYANRKYHSGLIWGGVTIGFACIKLSGSPNTFGLNKASKIKINNTKIIPAKSLSRKYGWNGTLSGPVINPVGLLDPVSCRYKICTMANPNTTNGSRKWKAKNRERVALSTEKPPQSHCTIISPTYGKADNKFVMTVAPQNDICPHGRTYPTKAVIITSINNVTPTFHASK